MPRSDEQIIELIKKPLSEDFLKEAKDGYKAHIRHVTGKGANDFLEETDIAGYETVEAKKLRVSLNRPRTVPVIGEDIEVFDKAFSASGYVSYHDFGGNKDKEKDFTEYLKNPIADGYTLRQWMADVWGKKIHYDYMGVAMVELPEQAKEIAEPYVIFKSINCIKDIGVKAGEITYLLYQMREEKQIVDGKEKKVEYYRYIDNERDVIIIEVDKKYSIPVEGINAPKPNTLGYVPGVFLSNLRDGEKRESYIYKALPHLDDLLLDSSIHAVSKKLFGFPHRWMYDQECSTCGGEGKVNLRRKYADNGRDFETIGDNCTSCKGTGKSYTMRPDKAIIKPMPDANNPDISEPAGFVTPPIETLQNQVEEMQRLQGLVHRAVWQHETIEGEQSSGNETATGRMLNISSYQSKLNRFSDNGEYVERKLIEMIGKLRYDTAYKGSVVNWGRRYYILNENQLELNYKEAKGAGMSAAVLKSILESVIYSKYSNDPLELRKQLRLLQTEPLPHLTVAEVQALTSVTINDKYLKSYFNDYVQQIENTSPDLLVDPNPEAFITRLNELNTEKMRAAGLIDEQGNAVSSDKREELKSTVGGFTGSQELADRVSTGRITPGAAAEQLQYFMGTPYNVAIRMVGVPNPALIGQQQTQPIN